MILVYPAPIWFWQDTLGKLNQGVVNFGYVMIHMVKLACLVGFWRRSGDGYYRCWSEVPEPDPNGQNRQLVLQGGREGMWQGQAKGDHNLTKDQDLYLAEVGQTILCFSWCVKWRIISRLIRSAMPWRKADMQDHKLNGQFPFNSYFPNGSLKKKSNLPV